MRINLLFNKNPLLFLQLSGWGVYLLADVFDHIASGHYFFAPSIICSISAFILTGVVAYITNKNDDKDIKLQGGIFLALLLVSAIVWHKIWSILHGDAETWPERINGFIGMLDYSFIQWITTGYYPLFAFIAWGGIFVGSKSYFAHQKQQTDLNKALLTAKQAQLQTLRYQLNPHFLFNVLNSIDISILSDDKNVAHNMVLRLSRFLRNTLENGEQDKISLEKEFEIIKDYSSIEQLRFGDALTLSVEVEVGCGNAMIPSMILQPLVENAIKFAWSQSEQGQVLITAKKCQNLLSIEIVNSLTKQNETLQGTGTGLKNTQERLALAYGEDASLHIKETSEHYTTQLLLPWEVSIT